jgi:hypothetical protein
MVIKTTSQKQRRKAIFTHIAGNILEIMVTKTAPKKESFTIYPRITGLSNLQKLKL